MTRNERGAGLVRTLLTVLVAIAALAVPPAGLAQEAGSTPGTAEQLQAVARQMLDQSEIERGQAAQYRALAEQTDDTALARERIERAETLEANAEGLKRRAAAIEDEIAAFEVERARYHTDVPERLPDTLIGRWQVAYIDRLRGPVRGEAIVHRSGRRIEARYGDEAYEAVAVSRREGHFLIDLQHRAPSVAPTDYTPPGEEIIVTPGTVTLALGDGETGVSLATPAPAEPGRVRLILAWDEASRTLTGHWAQRVDAVTGRDDGGGGRNGYPMLGSRETGGVTLFGREVWRRPEPRITVAFATENQRAIDEFGTPWWPDPDGLGNAGPTAAAAGKRRVLYVLGYGLPGVYGEPVTLESLDDDVDYALHSLEEDMERADFEGFYGNILADAQDRLEATEAVGTLAVPVTGDETRMLITATLKDGVTPGLKTFRLNGAEATWQLSFGDHRAAMSLTRDLTDGLDEKPADASFQSEWTDIVFLPETIYFEIRAERPLPYTEIPLLLALNDVVLEFNGKRSVPARRQPDDPLLYRTGPIRLVHPGAHDDESESSDLLHIGAYSGDRLTIKPRIAANTLIVSPPATTALIADHPIEAPVMAPITFGGPALSWKRAVGRAAACAGIDTAGVSIDALAGEHAESLDNYVFLAWLENNPWVLSPAGIVYDIVRDRAERDDSPVRLSVDISIGQHAAMILLRRTLYNRLLQTRRELGMLVDEGHMRGFRRIIEAAMAGKTPWDDLKVAAPDGGEIFFPQTFYDEILKRRYGLTSVQLDAYQIRATREALAAIRKHLDQAIDLVAAFEDCEVEDMLTLAGFGMGPILPRARNILMRCRDQDDSDDLGATAAETGGRCRDWVADRRARVHVDALELLRASFAEQEMLARWDSAVSQLFASVVMLPVGIVGGTVGATAAAIFDTGGLVIGTVGGIQTEKEKQRELDFARGAAILIGNDRYRVARTLDIDYTPTVMNAFLGVFMVGNDILGFRHAIASQRAYAAVLQRRIAGEIQSAYRQTRVELGRILARQLLRREVSLASLDRRQASDLSMAVAEAGALERTIGRQAMETAELEALEFARLVETGEISPITWSRQPPVESIAGDRAVVPPSRPVASDPEATVELDMPRFDPLEESGTFSTTGDRAWWSHDMSDDAYRRLRSLPMVERDDVIRLATRHPDAFSEALTDDLALDALYRPQPSLESLRNDLRRMADRSPPRGQQYYSQAHPDAGDPDHLYFDVTVSADGSEVVVEAYFGRPAPIAGSRPDADTITALAEQGEMARVGYFKLALEGDAVFGTGKRALVIDTIQTYPNVDVAGVPPRMAGPRSHAPAPTWVRDVDIPLRDDAPGVPFAMYSEHRSMQALGIEYGDASIGAVNLRNVQSANAAVELHWLRQKFPLTPDSELVRHTSLYRHAEAMLEQAGLRITAAQFSRDTEWAITAPAKRLLDDPWFTPARAADQSLSEARAAYLQRFGLSGSEEVEIGFDIPLRVEPIGG